MLERTVRYSMVLVMAADWLTNLAFMPFTMTEPEDWFDAPMLGIQMAADSSQVVFSSRQPSLRGSSCRNDHHIANLLDIGTNSIADK